MVDARPSSAVVLTRLVERDGASRVEVLLGRRAPQLKFFGGFLAFPGGTVDTEDLDWAGGSMDRALDLCAARELLEETGIGLNQAILDSARDDFRRALVAGEPIDHDQRETLFNASRRLTPFFDIETPPFTRRRYRARYYHGAATRDDEPELWPGEFVELRYFDCQDLIEAWTHGRERVAPPVLYVLRQLAERGIADGLREAESFSADLATGRLHPVWFVPGVFVAPLDTATKPPATTTNTFIVGTTSLVIVDPAPTRSDEQQRLFDEIDRRGDCGASVSAIALTHHHPDHVGAVTVTAKRYSVPVLGHGKTLDALDLTGIDTNRLDDGSRIDLGTAPDGSAGWHLEALFTPGHATGHLAFKDSRYGSLIAGDLVSPLSTIVIDPPEGHMRTYVDSLERLQKMDLGVVHPSHGPPVPIGKRIVDGFLAHRQEREERLLRALDSTAARSVDELVEAVYDDTPTARWGLAKRSLLAGLIKLEEDARAGQRGNGWLRLDTK